MTVVNNVELAPDSSPAKGVKIQIRVGGVPAASAAGSVVAAKTVYSATDGSWSVNLTPNSSISPAGTWYEFTRTYKASQGGAKVKQWAVVPSSGPVDFEDIIVSEPDAPPLTESELTAHLAHVDPHGQYLTQTEGDARYDPLGGGGGGGAPTGTAGGDLGGTYPNPTVDSTVVTNHAISDLAAATADLALGGHKLTGLAIGTVSGDAATRGQLDSHFTDVNDPHSAAAYAKLVGGGRRVWIQDSEPSGASLRGRDVWITETTPVLKVRNTANTAWTTLTASGTSSPPADTPPVDPTPPADVDRTADITNAINQWFAEYGTTAGAIVAKDEDVNKVTSEGLSYAMLFAVLIKDQAKFDKYRNWANQHLKRGLTPGVTTATNLWGWLYNNTTSAMTDNNFATDAEYDRALALARACQLWGRQEDYSDLKTLTDDLKNYTLNTDEGRAYQVSDVWQKSTTNGHHAISGGTTWENNISYNNPVAYRALKVYTNDTIWDQALSGHYDILTKATNNAGGLSTTTGLIPDWCDYSTVAHDVGPITNGTNGWTYTRSTNYGYDAFRGVFRTAQDAMLYNDARAKAYLTGTFEDWATAEWATSDKFVDTYTHTGAQVTSVQKLHMGYAAYFALKSANPSSGTAANIKSTWLSSLKVTNSFGTYFKDSPTSTASTYYGNAWMIFAEAMDAGLFAELALISGIAGKYASSPGSSSPPGSTPLPAGAVPLWVDPNSNAAGYASALPAGTKKTRFTWLANVPQIFWTGPEWDGSAANLTVAVNSAKAAGKWIGVAVYGIPGRDLGGASAGGSAGAAQYRNWMAAVRGAINTANAIVCIEPDSIAQMYQAVVNGAKTQADLDARMALINEAVSNLRSQCPNAKLYMDTAHSSWFPDPSPLMPSVIKAGVANCHGISVNVSNFRTDAECASWSNNILGKLNMPHLGYIWDCARNGKSPAPEGWDWENPLRTQFGRQPQYGGTILAGDSRAHGCLWIKRPGESDGNDPSTDTHGGPAAGAWWPEYLYVDGRADNANGTTAAGPLLASGNAGMLQRPPTPGVAL